MTSRDRLLSILLAVVLVFLCVTALSSPLAVQAQSVQVLSANPPSATQGTVNLNVLIKGKGFKRGALAKFLVTGTTDTGGVKVNSTTFVDATTLTANIDVADAAILSKYDIQVMNSDGRGGKGTELFAVTRKNETSCVTPPPVLTASRCSSATPGIPGCLDANFGGGTGRVMNPPGLNITGLAMQMVGSEERIVAVGMTDPLRLDPCMPTEGTIARYAADGTLDPTFGLNGVVTSPLKISEGNGVVVQPDKKLVVVGQVPVQVPASHGQKPLVVNAGAVARYNPEGTLDSTFGSGGVVAAPFGAYQGAFGAVTMQSDGKIVAAGSYGGRLALFRVNANGTIDTSFNGTGVYVHNTSSGAHAVTIQWVGPEERILVAGGMLVTSPIQHNNAVLFRFTDTGALDTSFGGSGILLTDFFGEPSQYYAVAVDSANRVVASGNVQRTLTEIGLARYDVFGNLDFSFGNGGIVIPPLPHAGHWIVDGGLTIQPDGFILVAGIGSRELDDPTGTGMASWRFTPEGTLDPTFGNNGFVSDCFTDYCFAEGLAMARQSDGKAVIAGFATIVDGTTTRRDYAALARYW